MGFSEMRAYKTLHCNDYNAILFLSLNDAPLRLNNTQIG